MAMEWSATDVLRVMKDNADANGKVDMPAVRTSFMPGRTSKTKEAHFEACLAYLEQSGRFTSNGNLIL